jgi:hypothetical protein
MIRSFRLLGLAGLALLLTACGDPSRSNLPAGVTNISPARRAASPARFLKLYWKPYEVTLIGIGKKNGAPVKLRYYRFVQFYFRNDCEPQSSVKLKLLSSGEQNSRLDWRVYQVYATVPGPYRCAITAINEKRGGGQSALQIDVAQ